MSTKKTIIVMTANSGFGPQSYFYSGAGGKLDIDWIQREWAAGKHITAAAVTAKGWFVAMSMAPQWTNQNFLLKNYWPAAEVTDYKTRGQFVTSCACDGSNWLVTLTSGTGISDQRIIVNAPWDQARMFVQQCWPAGYYITGIVCVAGLWTIVMSRGTIYTAQQYVWGASMEAIAAKILECWNAGYVITSIEFDDNVGEYMAVMSLYPGSQMVPQARTLNTLDPDAFIAANWPSKQITALGG